jgi:hypothetical protein
MYRSPLTNNDICVERLFKREKVMMLTEGHALYVASELSCTRLTIKNLGVRFFDNTVLTSASPATVKIIQSAGNLLTFFAKQEANGPDEKFPEYPGPN